MMDEGVNIDSGGCNMQDRVEEELKRLRNWDLEDLQTLLDKLEAMVCQQESAKPLHNVLDFEGIGHETWKDVDIEEYIKQERASWEDASKRISDRREQTGQSITEPGLILAVPMSLSGKSGILGIDKDQA
jgi:hypothetical protein